jgi:hypothetical protein
MIGAGDRNLAGLQRLAERVERLRLEFRNYVAVSPEETPASKEAGVPELPRRNASVWLRPARGKKSSFLPLP